MHQKASFRLLVSRMGACRGGMRRLGYTPFFHAWRESALQSDMEWLLSRLGMASHAGSESTCRLCKATKGGEDGLREAYPAGKVYQALQREALKLGVLFGEVLASDAQLAKPYVPITFTQFLQLFRACEGGLGWAMGQTFREAWRTCTRSEWMMWLVQRLGIPIKNERRLYEANADQMRKMFSEARLLRALNEKAGLFGYALDEAVKKTPAKKPVAKKVVAKKPVRKAPAKKKVVAKKAPARKRPTARKTAVKTVARKKTATRKR